MHVKSLKLFCDIVGERSFSRAADANGISQSGASQMVHQLEERLGVKLLDRSKRPFVLTTAGQAYYEGCRDLVQRYLALEEQLRSLRDGISGQVRIASIYSVGLTHMNEIVQQFLSQFPKANVRLRYEHPEKVIELVEQDVVDLGLISFPRETRHVEACVWRREPMVVVCAPTHPLAGLERIPLQQLEGATLIGFDQGLRIRREIDAVLAAAGVRVDVAMEFDNIETLKRALEIDAGVSLLPRPTVAREVQLNTLAVIELSDVEFERPIGIIWRRGKQLGETSRRFLQLLKDSPSLGPVADLDGSPQPGRRGPAAGAEPAPAGASPQDRDSAVHKPSPHCEAGAAAAPGSGPKAR